MPDRNVFLPLPADLYAEALALARRRRITVSDLLIQALAERIETEQHAVLPKERFPPTAERAVAGIAARAATPSI